MRDFINSVYLLVLPIIVIFYRKNRLFYSTSLEYLNIVIVTFHQDIIAVYNSSPIQTICIFYDPSPPPVNLAIYPN